jgi:hypothetical protein
MDMANTAINATGQLLVCLGAGAFAPGVPMPLRFIFLWKAVTLRDHKEKQDQTIFIEIDTYSDRSTGGRADSPNPCSGLSELAREADDIHETRGNCWFLSPQKAPTTSL